VSPGRDQAAFQRASADRERAPRVDKTISLPPTRSQRVSGLESDKAEAPHGWGVTMGYELWKRVKTAHFVLMAFGILAVGVGTVWDGPRWARASALIAGIVLLAVTAVLMERQRGSQGGA